MAVVRLFVCDPQIPLLPKKYPHFLMVYVCSCNEHRTLAHAIFSTLLMAIAHNFVWFDFLWIFYHWLTLSCTNRPITHNTASNKRISKIYGLTSLVDEQFHTKMQKWTVFVGINDRNEFDISHTLHSSAVFICYCSLHSRNCFA